MPQGTNFKKNIYPFRNLDWIATLLTNNLKGFNIVE